MRIKWPNDLLIEGAKVAGILLERSGENVVIGFGVNVSHHPDLPDRKTTMLKGRIWPDALPDVLPLLTVELASWLHVWRDKGVAAIAERWMQLCHEPGTPLTVRLPDGESIDGQFGGLDRDGALILRLADGTSRVIHAGDVFLI